MVSWLRGQGLNLTGAYQRRDRLTVSCWGCGAGDVDRNREVGEWGIMHHLSDTQPVRSRHGTRDTGINDYMNCLGWAWDMHFSSSGSGVWKINVTPLPLLAKITNLPGLIIHPAVLIHQPTPKWEKPLGRGELGKASEIRHRKEYQTFHINYNIHFKAALE